MQGQVKNDMRVYEVRVFDRTGKLKKVISQKALVKRADELFKSRISPLRNYRGRPRSQAGH
ncbi:MAG: hypothetical protein ACE5E9_01570 [Nitrospinaceae bacterium]